MKNLTLSGASDGRGRNGWFTPRRVSTWPASDGRRYVEIWSKATGDNPPILLTLTDADRLALAALLLEDQ